MTLFPANKLIWVLVLSVLPLAGIVTALPAVGSLAVGVLLVIAVTVTVDAGLSRNCFQDIRVRSQEVVRLSTGREGQLVLQIESALPRDKDYFFNLVFPVQIFSPHRRLGARLEADKTAVAIDWPCKGLRQGCYAVTRGWIETASPLGLWQRRRMLTLNCEVRVYPNLLRDHQELAALLLRASMGVHHQRQIGKGREFEQLRDYLPGDSFDDIHWKATAKRNNPVSKVFQIERTQQVYVILDASRLSARLAPASSPTEQTADGRPTEPLTIFEQYISAGLLLAQATRRQSDLFGLVVFSDKIKRYVPAGSGQAHFGVCRDALYTLQADRSSPDFNELFTFIGTRIRRRALLIFLTALDDPVLAENFTGQVGLVGRKHIVMVNMIRPDGAAPLFSEDATGGLDDLYRHLAGHLIWRDLRQTEKVLARQGIGLAMMDTDRIGAHLINQYLTIKKRQIL